MNDHKNDRTTTKRTVALFWRYTMRYKRNFYIGSIGSVLAVAVQNIIPPFVVAKAFARLQSDYARHEVMHFSTYKNYFIVYAVAMFLGMVLWRVQAFHVWTLEENVMRDLAEDSYDHLQSQSQRFHADRFSGALVSQTNKFLGGYERLMDDLIWSIIPIISTLVFAIGVLLFVSPLYGVVLIAVIALYVALVGRQISHQLPYNVKQANTESKQTAELADSLANLATTRAFAHEDYESTRFKKATTATRKAYRKLSIEVAKTEALSHVQTNGFQVIALFFGLLAVTRYHENVSLLYLALSYTQTITNQLWVFGRVVRNVNRGFGDSAEMTKIMAIKPEITDAEQPETSRIIRGAVEFKGVGFAYPENETKPLFSDLSFKIKPGEKVGLVGPSGGGKTSITKLLLRFMDIQEGVISVDGQDVTSLRQADLRSHIAYVAQEPVLFHRSLSDNIRYGQLDADDQTIKAVAKLAHADGFISALPEGYETFVGERGVKLSGGQRQRVAIARAMLKNAPILVLDEATSALDSESEVLIQDALWKLMENRTAIVIAHRLSTIQKMDRIIVLEGGRIVEQGSHKELLQLGGAYAKLWAHQSGGFMED